MRIQYYAEDDILIIVFSNKPIIKDTSFGWCFNIGHSSEGISEITILNAKENGYWPIENAADLLQSLQ